jgi:DNA modification methylase
VVIVDRRAIERPSSKQETTLKTSTPRSRPRRRTAESPARRRNRLSLEVPIGRLKPNPRNPRNHNAAQVEAIAKSIDAFGFNAPILVDREDTIIAGHGRYLAAKRRGLNSVPVIRLEHLTPAQAQAYMLADNKLSDRSDWDEKLLAVHLRELAELAVDFEVEATGFEVAEIDMRIQGLGEQRNAGEPDPADELPAIDEQPISRPGDLWTLGRHRLFCGDSLDSASYAILMDGELAAMVIADPPYNVPINGHVSGLGKIRHREFAMATGEMSPAEFTGFLTDFRKQCAEHSRDSSIQYVFTDWRHLDEMLAAARAVSAELINLCVWNKTTAGMGSFYRSQHELVLVFKKGRSSHQNNVQLGRHGRNRSNVWTYPSVNGAAAKGHHKQLKALHPTVKPVALVADAILDTTARKDIVLDPFMGSGTTIMAAELTGRRGYGIEIDPLYVDRAIRRWQGFTGKIAYHQSGRSFAELERKRSTGDDVAAE